MKTARRLAIHSQGLDGRWRLARGKEGVARTIERLGYVQIDTIAVVQRAHHHTLWSRRPDYTPEMLHELQAVDRRVFEYWTHAASYVPMSDFRYYRPRMRGHASGGRTRHWLEANAKLVEHVLKRIATEGRLGSADFADPRGKRGTWWDWKPAKQALEMLFSAGKLMVAERRNFHRLYDLTERVLPPGIDTTEPSPDEMSRFRVRRALAGHGMAKLGEREGKGAAEALEELISAGEVVAVKVAGADEEPQYALREALEEAARASRTKKRLHLLSPFDNLIISRHRLRELFDFDYSLECYRPAPKRRYGYFCLPILWGDEFVGRLDPKADRKQKTLLIRKVILEPDSCGRTDFLPALAAKLWALAAFNECERVVIERTTPAKLKAALRRELRAGGR